MIKILHVVNRLDYGGLTSFIMNYYRNMDCEKIQFDFLYIDIADTRLIKEINDLGGMCYRLPPISHLFSFIKETKFFFSNNASHYIALHCHALFGVALFGGIAKRYGVKRIIAHSHGIGYGDSGVFRRLRNRFFVNWAKNKSDIHIACSTEAADFMFGKNDKSVLILHNAIDVAKFKFSNKARMDIRTKLNLERVFVIGNVGNVEFVKNQSFLIDILSKMSTSGYKIVLLIVGNINVNNDNTYSSLVEKIEIEHLENSVIFTGQVNNVAAYLSAMDCFVFPSLHEGYGISLVEAQASGLVCLVSDTVPKETKILKTLEFISLKSGTDIWTEKIMNASSSSHSQMISRDVNETDFKNYDIKHEVKKLESLYLGFIE